MSQSHVPASLESFTSDSSVEPNETSGSVNVVSLGHPLQSMSRKRMAGNILEEHRTIGYTWGSGTHPYSPTNMAWFWSVTRHINTHYFFSLLILLAFTFFCLHFEWPRERLRDVGKRKLNNQAPDKFRVRHLGISAFAPMHQPAQRRFMQIKNDLQASLPQSIIITLTSIFWCKEI